MQFIEKWKSNLKNIDDYPSLRTYCLVKFQFKAEYYLEHIQKKKYLIAFTRFRVGSHTLEIERGRYSNPRIPINQRLCSKCVEVEDEIHFLLYCALYEKERIDLFNNIIEIYPKFVCLTPNERFQFLMTCSIPNILTWVAKFIHDSMLKRSKVML